MMVVDLDLKRMETPRGAGVIKRTNTHTLANLNISENDLNMISPNNLMASAQQTPAPPREREEEESEQIEEASYHHPSPPSSELFDVRTTVDPSYIISLIRKLVPCNVKNQAEDDTAPMLAASWEECGCILWDLAVNKNHALFMVDNLLLEVLLASLTVSQSVRVTEICLGILANIACHEISRNHMVSMPGLVDKVVDQLFLDDSLCLSEAFRLLTLGLQGSGSLTWAKALQPEHILCHILWIAENTLNSQLLEKNIGLVLAIIDGQQEVAHYLLPPLMKLGLPNLIVSLLACEMNHLSGERAPDRYSVLDTLLRVIEALSVLDNYSGVISYNKELLRLIYDLVKLPDKIEVSSCCVTAVVLIANIFTDEPDLAFGVFQDLPFLQGLLGLIPLVSNDSDARSALWSVLGKVLAQVQEDNISSPSLQEYVAVLVDSSDYIIEDLTDHHLGYSKGDPHSSNTSLTETTARRKSLSRIRSILQRWTTIRENMTKNDRIEEDCTDDESVEKLLQCCNTPAT